MECRKSKLDKEAEQRDYTLNHPQEMVIQTQASSIFAAAKEEAITNQPSNFRDSYLILLVEDNIIALRLVETIVKQAGCRFFSVTDGEQALALVKSIAFDLIITDIGLPGISGAELTHFIRGWEKSLRKKPIPIIGLTAHALGESEAKCLQSGMNKVISKPIYLSEMQELIKKFVKKNTENAMLTTILGRGLPDNEEQLFALDQFPLLDFESGIKNIGDESILKDLLRLLIDKAMPEDKTCLQKAYGEKNWQQIGDLAHKMKSGALYCGAIKMQYACQYLECYRKAGHSLSLEKLYYQLIQILEETKQYVGNWLLKQEKCLTDHFR